jgi:hypothetical protein
MKTILILRAKDQIEQLMKPLISASENLELQQLRLTPEELTLVVASTQGAVQCPVCGQEARRVHSTYWRTLQDLPWGSFRLQLQVRVHRFFCTNPDCFRKIFTERLPELMEPSARRTTRLRGALRAIGWALGGRAGARQCAAHTMPICATTLLAILRREGSAAVPTLSSFWVSMIGHFAPARLEPCWLI